MNFNELYLQTCPSTSILAGKGDAENLGKLVKLKKPTNGQDNRGWRALHHACNGGHLDCVKILLNAVDVDINAISFERQTALYLTVCSNLCPDLKVHIARTLLEAGADANYENQKQFVTILNQAVSFGNLPLVKLLLEYKVNVNEHDDKFGSTLNTAVRTKNLEMVKLITKERLEYNFRHHSKFVIIDFFHCAVRQNSTEILQHLVKNPPSVTKINFQDSNGRTSLFLACMMGYREGIKLLLDHGADPNIKDNEDVLPVIEFADHVQEEDFACINSLFGKLIRMTNKRDFKKPSGVQSSFFHRLPFFKNAVAIYDYMQEYFTSLNVNGVIAPIDLNSVIPVTYIHKCFSESPTVTPLAYFCGLPHEHNKQSRDIFFRMVEDEEFINDMSDNKVPPLVMAIGNSCPHPFLLEQLIRNGANPMMDLNVHSRWNKYNYPSAVLFSFFSSDPSITLDAVFAFGIPPEFILSEQEVVNMFLMESTEKVNWRSFFQVVFGISKYVSFSFFSNSTVQMVAGCLFHIYNKNPSPGLVNDERRLQDEKEFEELSQKYKTSLSKPQSLCRLAALQVRHTLWRERNRIARVSLYLCVEELFREVQLPIILKDILLFRH